MKKATIFVVLLIAFVLGVYLVWDNYFSKDVVYGTSSDPDNVNRYREDCNKKGGKLNECGSPEGNFAAVCYYICEIR